MQIKDKQYYIYIRSARQRVYVTKEQFEATYTLPGKRSSEKKSTVFF